MLSAAHRAALRESLTGQRTDLAAQVASLAGELAGIVESSELVATDDEHDPEGATIAFERSQATSLLGLARGRLAEVDRAVDRLEDGTYGACERCGDHIGVDRLRVLPAARRCIGCAAGTRR